jgi:hypothetical protein
VGNATVVVAHMFETCNPPYAGAPHASYTDAFVQTHRVGVCRGPYPAAFVKAWKAWDKRRKSENDFIGGLPDEQLYAVFAMANCGRDLESYQLQGYEQVRSMMLQVGSFFFRGKRGANCYAQARSLTTRVALPTRIRAVGQRLLLITKGDPSGSF